MLDIATLLGSRAWIAIEYQTKLVDINGKILVTTNSRRYGAVTALSNDNALYTPSDNVIGRVDQTGKVSAFIYLKSEVYNILTVSDDVFITVKAKIFKLDHKGMTINILKCNVVALTSLPQGKAATIDGEEKMMVIQSIDCGVLNRDLDVTIGSKADPSGTAFTADQHGRIIRGHGCGTTIHVFQVEGEKVTRLKDYNVPMEFIGNICRGYRRVWKPLDWNAQRGSHRNKVLSVRLTAPISIFLVMMCEYRWLRSRNIYHIIRTFSV